MTKKRLTLYLLFIVVVSVSLVVIQRGLKQNKVCFRSYCFSVELAKTKISQAKGLMFARELAWDRGMLFVFKEEAPRSFWMKNTLIPLDVIFLNRNKEVVAIEKNAQPCRGDSCGSIRPQEPSKYVLELNADIADKINLKIGDRLWFEF